MSGTQQQPASSQDGAINLAVAGGGTGGHLFPGLAVAELARSNGLARTVLFLGAERGIESRLVPAAGHELVAHPVTGMRGAGPLGAVRALQRLSAAVLHTRAELRRRRVDVLIGLGGYASAPGVIGAWLAGVPIVLLEQNREPGISNRLLARLAAAVCTSFDDSARYLPKGRARLTGNPVRAELEGFTGAASAQRDTLLVFGGSAGAVTLNRAVTRALTALAGQTELPPVLHQAGARGMAEVTAAYREAADDGRAVAAEVVEFIDDMAGAYRRALLAVCRAGATSVAELVATGTPAVLVPYPHAAGDHQTSNAQALAEAGAAVLVPDDDGAPDRLTQVVGRLLRNREELDSMAANAAAVGRPGAAGRVLDVVRAVLKRTR